ncbi:MAG: glycosyltransferase N-terminal domain-containing protein [Flavobacteriaceae bacterium]
MLFLYNILIAFVGFLLKIIALFNKKIKLFVNGRKQSFSILSEKLNSADKTIWFHAASLGEYEQGLPVMEQFKKKFPNHKLVLTFFSPSGYEVRKNNTVADVTVYLPWDTKRNVQQFLKIVQPEKAIFVKYEYWMNYLTELKKQNIPTYLISGIFRENQAFFKWYGGFYRRALHCFTHFFVQNESSGNLIKSLGFTNVTVSGDTRFDRVYAIAERDNHLDFVEEFKGKDLLVVAGSSWEPDEKLLVEYINQNKSTTKFVIAPHNIKSEQIQSLKSQINRSVVLFSEKEGKNLSDFEVLIIDTIGILTKIYSYADIAYVGGGFGNPGVHNVLEPAVFGIPTVIGKNYSHFAEATQLVNLKGVISIKNQQELNQILDKLLSEEDYRKEKGKICADFIVSQKGATQRIMDFLTEKSDFK